jgi:hypothetical protein
VTAPFDTHPVRYDMAQSIGLSRGFITSLTDGDSAWILTDRGCDISYNLNVRIANLWAAEMTGASATLGAEHLAQLAALVPVGSPVLVRTYRTVRTDREVRSFTRYVADVLMMTPGGFVNVATLLPYYDPLRKP